MYACTQTEICVFWPKKAPKHLSSVIFSKQEVTKSRPFEAIMTYNYELSIPETQTLDYLGISQHHSPADLVTFNCRLTAPLFI